jgi:glycosyltransferase involved in cell wall biosynthesis
VGKIYDDSALKKVSRGDGLKVAFVVGLSEKKLAQKLAPLQAMPEVTQIDLYRRRPFVGEKVRWMEMPSCCTHFAPMGDLWRFLTLLKKATNYDILVGCHQRFHGIYAAVAGAVRGRPVIQLVINDLAYIEKTFLGSWSLRMARAIGFRGRITMERFQSKYGNSALFFVPQNAWELPPPIGHLNKTIDVLYVGNLAETKNMPVWLQTAAEVKRRLGRLRAAVVSETCGKDLAVLAKSLGLQDVIEFTGPLFGQDLDRCYAKSRVLLLTSFWEGLPMVAAEAMAMGVPVVATDTGDVRELVRNGENGYLVKVGDVQAAARSVVQLLKDEALYNYMSANARSAASHLASESTLKHLVKTWRDVFVELGVLSQKSFLPLPHA